MPFSLGTFDFELTKHTCLCYTVKEFQCRHSGGCVIQHRLTSFLREPLFCFKFLHLVATGSEPNRDILRCFSKLHNFFFFRSLQRHMGKAVTFKPHTYHLEIFGKNIYVCQIIFRTKIINYHSHIYLCFSSNFEVFL